jgi:hypothetical protein
MVLELVVEAMPPLSDYRRRNDVLIVDVVVVVAYCLK